MDDVNSALEKLLGTLDPQIRSLDRAVAEHIENFGEFYHNINRGRNNKHAAQVYKRDIKRLQKRVKTQQNRVVRENALDSLRFVDIFLRHTKGVLYAQETFIDYFFNPETTLRPRDLFFAIFDEDYSSLVESLRDSNDFYELDHQKQRDAKFFTKGEISSREREPRRISEMLLPEIKKFLVDFAISNGLLREPINFDIGLTREECHWKNNGLYLDMDSFRYTRDNGHLNLYLVKALGDASHELGHGIHQINSQQMPDSLKASDDNEFGLVQRAPTEGIAHYWESKMLEYLLLGYKNFEIVAPEGLSEKLSLETRDDKEGKKQRIIRLDQRDLQDVIRDYKLGAFWLLQDFIAHTNEMNAPLSKEEQRTFVETGNYCLARNSDHNGQKYTERLLNIAVVVGAPYFKGVLDRIRKEYVGVNLGLAQRVSMIGAWSREGHYPFMNLLFEAMGYKKREKKKTKHK